MKKQDIIRQFGEAKYQAALESAKKNDFAFVDELLTVNGEIVVTENFEQNLLEFLWQKKALSPHERLKLMFEFFEVFPTKRFAVSLLNYYNELERAEREFLAAWFERQLLRGGRYSELIEAALSGDLPDESYISTELWGFLVREDSPPQILKFVLPISGAVPYALKKELYTRIISDKSWHPYILKSLVASLVWYGGLDKEDAKKVYAQLEIPAGYESLQATFVEGIEAYEEVQSPAKPLAHRRKKKTPFD